MNSIDTLWDYKDDFVILLDLRENNNHFRNSICFSSLHILLQKRVKHVNIVSTKHNNKKKIYSENLNNSRRIFV